MTTENQVPWLRSGVGDTPADGGCIMQIIDWISANGWTDSPDCVHPVFQELAIKANDSMSDVERQKLLDLVPRLMNTNTADKEISARLAIFLAKKVLPIWEKAYPNDNRSRLAIEAAEANVAVYAAANVAVYAAANTAAYIAADDAANVAAYVAAYAANIAASAANTNTAANAAYAAANAAYAAANAANTSAAAAVNAAASAANTAANAVAAYPANAAFSFLVDTLDYFDSIVNRTVSDEIDYSGVCAVMTGAI